MASILLVDDDPNVETTISAVLRNESYDVTSGSNITAARELLRQRRFDVVISEQAFDEPGDGLELLIEAQQRSRSGAIVLTSYGSEHAEILAREMGLHHYLRKPCSIELLRRTVQLALDENIPRGEQRIIEDARGGLKPTEIEND